jgi:hypothetical protein
VNVPITAYRKQFGGRRSVDVFVKAYSPQRVVLAEDEVRAILRARRNTPFQAHDPFGIVTGDAVMTIYRSITIGLFAVMVLISGISLVVGGIVHREHHARLVTERNARDRRAHGPRRAQEPRSDAVPARVGPHVLLGRGPRHPHRSRGVAALVTTMTGLAGPRHPLPRGDELGVAAGVGLLAGIVALGQGLEPGPVDALRSE